MNARPQTIPAKARGIGTVWAVALMLAGCASLSPDGGMSTVSAYAGSELGKSVIKVSTPEQAAAAQASVSALLRTALSADTAVQIALLNNRGLQAEYNALGISEASYVAASLPPNPAVSISRSVIEGDLEVERRLIANILGLLTLPSRRQIAEREFEAARYRAIEATFRVAAATRQSYYRAVAARQRVVFLDKARMSAEAAAELNRKLGETGAATKLNQARAGAFYAEVSNELAQARLDAATEREALTRNLGLWGTELDFKLPSQLPNLPPQLQTADQVEIEAIRKRVDLIAARIELDALARSLGLEDATRYISAFELAGIANFERTKDGGHVEKERSKGHELELAIEVPIFDGGQSARRSSRETYMAAVNRFTEQAINIRSQARTAYLAYRASYDISRQYRTQILPLRETINEQALLEYNGMLIDVFELLTTTQESIDSNVAAIDAKRDFFLAKVNFEHAVIGGGSAGGDDPAGRTVTAQAPAGGGH